MQKKVPFTQDDIKNLTKKFSTPFYIYDEVGIRKSAEDFLSAFSWNKEFREYFAVKATPNPVILKLLKKEGIGVDCSSMAELVLAERCGFKGEQIMFTSNGTTAEEYQKAKALGAIINLDDITHIPYLEENAVFPDIISFRFNPGRSRSGNDIIGKPEDAKFGVTKKQLFEGYDVLQQKGVKRFGLHTMLASNELNPQYFIDTAEMLFELCVEIHKKLGIQLEFINLGGGIGIPYRPEDKKVDLAYLGREIQKLYSKKLTAGNLAPALFMECGRVITGPHGYLVARVLHMKDTYKKYVGLDATMANLMRPGMYGAYHHISVLGREKEKGVTKFDVTGSLCENNDKFAVDRLLPNVKPGDFFIIHDAGAHGHAMGFNYNGKLRSAEFLIKEDGKMQMIRRSETLDDYFATLIF